METELTVVPDSKSVLVPPSKIFCNCCFTKVEPLYTYQLKTFVLHSAFGVNSLSLCYICKEAAQQAEKFIEKVQQVQHLLKENHGDMKSDITCIPFKKLKRNVLDRTEISPEDPLNVQSLKKEGHVYESSFPGTSNIKLEVEVSGEDGAYNYVNLKKEIDLAEHVYADQFNYQGNQLENEEKTEVFAEPSCVEQKVDVPKDESDNDDDDFSYEPEAKDSKVDKLGKKVIRMEITKKECLQERAAKLKEDKFLAAVYKCEDCIKTFSMKVLLDDHMVVHSDSRGEHACEICKRRLAKRKDVDRHMLYHLVRYKCAQCPYRAAQHNYAMDHYLTTHCDSPPDYPCGSCGKSFPTLRGLKSHHSNIHKHAENRGIHKCDYCDIKPFATRAGLSYHVKHQHSEQVSAVIQRYSCPQCQKGFRTPAQLKAHIGTHNTSRDFYCVECDKYFKTKEALYNHYMTNSVHVNNTQVKSREHPTKCYRRCVKRRASLKKTHELGRNPASKITYSCDQCEKRFGYKHLLRRHIERDHEKIRNYRCDPCDRDFFSKPSYTRHMALVHEKDPLAKLNQPRLPCSICDKTFITKKTLDSHQRVHTGERPFKCVHCNADFSQSGSLHNHIKLVHLGLTRTGTPKGKIWAMKIYPDCGENIVQPGSTNISNISEPRSE